MPSVLKNHSFVLPFLRKVKPELHGLHRLFNRYEYGESTTIVLGQFSHHYLMPDDVPKESDYSEKIVAGEAGFDTYTVPQFSLSTTITQQMLERQVPEEYLSGKPYSVKTREQWNTAMSLIEMTKTMGRELERQASKALFNGKIDFSHSGLVDFKRDPNNTLTVAKKWSDPSANIYDDLTALVKQIVSHGGRPNVVIMGSQAWNALFNNEKIHKMLDMNNLNIGDITPKMTASGMLQATRLNVYGYIIPFYVYNEVYEKKEKDGSYSSHYYLDPNAVMMLDSTQDMYTYFSRPPVMDKYVIEHISLDGIIFQAYRYDSPPSGYVLGIKSRPLLFPTQPNRTAVLMADGTKVK